MHKSFFSTSPAASKNTTNLLKNGQKRDPKYWMKKIKMNFYLTIGCSLTWTVLKVEKPQPQKAGKTELWKWFDL